MYRHTNCIYIGSSLCFGFSRYGSAMYDLCIVAENNHSQTVYHEVTFYGLLLLVCTLMLCMRCHQWILELQNDPRAQSKLFLASKTALQFYPIVLMICWIPTLIVDNTGPQTSTPFHIFSCIIRISHGFIVAVIYFKTSNQARKYFWISLSPMSWIALLSSNKDSIALLSESYLRDRESTMEMRSTVSKVRNTEDHSNSVWFICSKGLYLASKVLSWKLFELKRFFDLS